MAVKIALAGNPNCGKTTLFNDLTGSSQYVGNWPGVTVEKKEGVLRGATGVVIQDLPGIYSLSPYTKEEVVARSYLVLDQPDAILNIVDASNLERNLYLTTQLAELGIPMVVALNMIDVTRKRGDKIDLKKLGEALKCEVVEICALRGEGGQDAAKKAAALGEKHAFARPPRVFEGSVGRALDQIEALIEGEKPTWDAGGRLTRWHAVKLFERDERVKEQAPLSPGVLNKIEEIIAGCEKELDDDAESIITNQRYAFIARVMSLCVKKGKAAGALTISDKIDRVVTNRFLALPLFALIMFLVYYISVTYVGALLTDFTNDTLIALWIQAPVMNFLTGIGTADWLVALIGDGVIGGVGAVIGFVPQLLVLFLLLSILEDVGYMARVAFIMDRVFRKFGLSGKSFIPMLISSGCGVPGIMASRTIENERDRRMTIMTATFIPCGAKMPIVGLIAGALFHNAGWVAFSAYILGVAAVIVSGVMLKKTKPFSGDPAPFVMELPAYHAPSGKNVLRSVWERGSGFVRRAGSVIVVASVLIWFTSGYGLTAQQPPENAEAGAQVIQETESAPLVFGAVDHMDDSLLGRAGSLIAPVFEPMGFGSWQATVATAMGLVAKEEVVGVFGVLYPAVGENTADSPVMRAFDESSGGHGQLAAFCFLIFNLLCAPCFAAMGAIRREMNSGKWTAFAIAYQCLFAYSVALIVYQTGLLLSGAPFTWLTAAAFALTAGMAYMLFRKNGQAVRSAGA